MITILIRTLVAACLMAVSGASAAAQSRDSGAISARVVDLRTEAGLEQVPRTYTKTVTVAADRFRPAETAVASQQVLPRLTTRRRRVPLRYQLESPAS